MKLLKLYSYFAGTMPDFASQFKNNESLYKQAIAFWNKMEGFSIFIVLLFVIMGILMAFLYYGPYNKQPGRHYTPYHWLGFLAATFILTFLVTLGFEYFAASPRLNGAMFLQTKIAFGNALYASSLYFITSFVWCNWLPTNAYRLLKF